MKKSLLTLFAILAVLLLFPMSISADDAHEHAADSYRPLENNQHTYLCSCGEQIVEDCNFSPISYNDVQHFQECYQCMQTINCVPHTIVDCKCTGCLYTEHSVESWKDCEGEDVMHEGVCQNCGELQKSYHSIVQKHNENGHWQFCDSACGHEKSDDVQPHEKTEPFEISGILHASSCVYCNYSEREKHVDENGDKTCDVASCSAVICVDANNDHVCDDCLCSFDDLCVDTDGNHICAVCQTVLKLRCTDENDDHRCDSAACARYLSEFCFDANGDYVCDGCNNNCCPHYDVNDPVPNGDGTHTVTCNDCNTTETVSCYVFYSDWDKNGHVGVCLCNTVVQEGAHTMDGCECTVGWCDYHTHDVSAWTINEENEYMHTGTCLLCGETLTVSHDYNVSYDELGHYYFCHCGYSDAPEEHEMSDVTSIDSQAHGRVCYYCNYEEREAHYDENGDMVCDHELCTWELCVDADDDHICDDCGAAIQGVCQDDDGDHTCDGCDAYLWMYCNDENGDHVCDTAACGEHLDWICTDDDGDLFCDDCGQMLCNHDLLKIQALNESTHKGTCRYCSAEVTEECTDIMWDYTSDEHYGECLCGNRFNAEKHTYEENYIYNASAVGHWHECDECSYRILVRHTEGEGACDVCDAEWEEIFPIYVGGVGLQNGQYLDLAGNVTDSEPAGGYAHYLDGVLTLKNYAYEGEGTEWEASEYELSHAAILATDALVLYITGDNLVSCTYGKSDAEEFSEEEIIKFSDGIVTFGNLTLRGDGTLSVFAENDGVHIPLGNFTVESGTLFVGTFEKENGAFIPKAHVGDDGIDVDAGSLTVLGGSFYVNSDDHAFDIREDLTVLDGHFYIYAGDDGINVDAYVTISGGQMQIKAEDIGIDADDGMLLSDGNFEIEAGDCGLESSYLLLITGGNFKVRVQEGNALHTIYGEAKIMSGSFDLKIADTEYCTLFDYPPTCSTHIRITDANGNPLTLEACVNEAECKITATPCTYAEQLRVDGDDHVATCTECENEKREAHSGGTASCTEKAKCALCHAEYGDPPSHTDADANALCDLCATPLEENNGTGANAGASGGTGANAGTSGNLGTNENEGTGENLGTNENEGTNENLGTSEKDGTAEKGDQDTPDPNTNGKKEKPMPLAVKIGIAAAATLSLGFAVVLVLYLLRKKKPL